MTKAHNTITAVRIDKWLWAARFFRTRSLAKDAIEGGKVHCQGERVKVSKEIRVGMQLKIRQGLEEKVVEVLALSEVRSSAPVAQLLYHETAESLERRMLLAENRRLLNQARPEHRPNKHERQQLDRFQRHISRYDSSDEGF